MVDPSKYTSMLKNTSEKIIMGLLVELCFLTDVCIVDNKIVCVYDRVIHFQFFFFSIINIRNDINFKIDFQRPDFPQCGLQ